MLRVNDLDMIYGEKEIRIFEGLLRLIANGANPHGITVSEIAKSAGIGKGTIYEYFNTKDELIARAILYNIGKEIEQYERRISNKTTFQERFEETLKIVEENMNNMFSSSNIFSPMDSFKDYYQLIMEKYDISSYIQSIQKILDDLLKSGYKDGILKEGDKDYGRLVLKSAICAFVDATGMKIKERRPISPSKAREYAYTMVTKSLS